MQGRRRGILVAVEGTAPRLRSMAVTLVLPCPSSIVGGILHKRTAPWPNAQCAHMLHCAEMWSHADDIERTLESGHDVVVRPYVFTFCAIAEANGLDGAWARGCSRGLPQPDVVVFDPVASTTRRGQLIDSCIGGRRDHTFVRSDGAAAAIDRARRGAAKLAAVPEADSP